MFDPRAAARGDVARALFYVRAVYPERVAAAEGWFRSQFPALLAWHEEAAPPGNHERQHSAAVARWQGAGNPFVLDATLADRAFAPRPTSGDTSGPDAASLMLGPPRPNPSTGRVAFDLMAPPGTHVRAVVLDALGREVAVLLDGPVTGPLTLAVDDGPLAPGVYALRVTTTTGTAAQRFTVAH